MEDKEIRVQVSPKWKLFQLYSLQVASGGLSCFVVLNFPFVERAFIRANLEPLYAYFVVAMIIVCVMAFFFSGGIGILRLINARRLLKLIEKEEDNGV